MASVPPPQGMNEVDYETIEAAVTETVRGRWFLNEFARRNRTAEMRQLLEAIGRLEGAVSAGQQALPPADPSIRLLMQRIKEVSAQLENLSGEMREAGLDPRFTERVDHQARAVAGMLRGPAPSRPALPGKERLPTTEMLKVEGPGAEAPKAEERAPAIREPERVENTIEPPGTAPPESKPTESKPAALPPPAPARMPRADLPPALSRVEPPRAAPMASDDPRLAVLSALDGLALAKKLALFS